MSDESQTQSGFVPVDAVFSGGTATGVNLSAGDKLREARARLGLTLDSASARTRIRREYLEALETMDPRGLPSRAYAIGYLRTYARFLELDELAIVDQFKTEADTQTGRAQPTAHQEKREIRLPKGVFGAVAILAAVSGIAWWYANTASGEGAFADIPPPPDAELERTSALTPFDGEYSVADRNAIWGELPGSRSAASTLPDIILEASAPAWLEVRDASGRILFSRDLEAGEFYRAIGEPGLMVSTNNAGAVSILIEGENLGPLGEEGAARDGIALDARRQQTAAIETATD
tara:strand:- start:262 stop:1134 length:873 start_codon:yes stop_codon:yes gene_type:complete